MIKATGITKTGVPLLILGLAPANAEDVLNGQPIYMVTNELDTRMPAMHVVVMGGENEGAIVAELERLEIRVDGFG